MDSGTIYKTDKTSWRKNVFGGETKFGFGSVENVREMTAESRIQRRGRGQDY